MMVRVRTISVALALCAAALAPEALAQPVMDTPALAPAQPAIEGDALDAPAIPEVPEALRARVAALTAIAEETTECYTERGERTEHIADRRCRTWYAQLLRGGPAGAHAIGAVLLRGEGEPGAVGYNEGAYQRGPRLVQVLAATRSPDATPYLLRLLAVAARDGEAFGATEQEALRQLARVTSADVTPSAPWERDAWSSVDARRRGVSAWLRWWRAHEGDRPAQLLASATSRAVTDLTAEDPALRFAAMQRLAGAPVHRPAVAAALRDLLARRDLPARAAVYLRRWAQRVNIPTGAPTVLASRS